MSLTAKKGLLGRIRRGRDARASMVENNLSESIAFQIAATRDANEMTQAQLAEAAGISNNLPRLEDPEYGKHTLSTLRKLAAALDVALVVRFVPFSQYVNWLSGTPSVDYGLRPEALAVPSFTKEETHGIFENNTRIWERTNGSRIVFDQNVDSNQQDADTLRLDRKPSMRQSIPSDSNAVGA